MATTQITIRVDRVEGNYRENEVALRRELRWNEGVITGRDERRRGHIAEIMEELRRMTRSIGVHYGCWRDEGRTTASLPLMIARLEALRKRSDSLLTQRTGYDAGYTWGQIALINQLLPDLKLFAQEEEIKGNG